MSLTSSMTMSAPAQQPIQPQKDIYTYIAPWTIYGMAWSERRDQPYRLAIGSFIEEYNNKVSIVQLRESSGNNSNNNNNNSTTTTSSSVELQQVASCEHNYPTTKIQWYPSGATNVPDLLATSGDYLRLYQVQESSVVKQSIFNNVRLVFSITLWMSFVFLCFFSELFELFNHLN